jgi:hypothetical protein
MLNYAERFEAAVDFLVSDGPVKQRLAQAYSDYLEALQDQDLPVSVRNAISELHAAMHRVAPMGKESCVKASVQKMSPREAAGHAEAIVRIYVQLLTQGERSESLKVVETEIKSPPRYLVGAS